MPHPAPGTPVEGCTHRNQHTHGTRHAHQRCCKCETCAEASRLYHRVYARKVHGWTPRVDAAGARTHVAALRDQGTPLWWIADRSGVGLETISHLTREDRATITRATHDLLMAVDPAPGVFRGNRMEATSTVRRLRHLALMGWPTRHVSAVSGLNERHLGSIRQGDQRFVTGGVAERVARATRELIGKEPPASQASTAARNHARRNGWVSMFAYDDLDDPEETPNITPLRARKTRDEAAHDRLDDLAHLIDAGIPAEEAVTRAGYPTVKAAYEAAKHKGIHRLIPHLLSQAA